MSNRGSRVEWVNDIWECTRNAKSDSDLSFSCSGTVHSWPSRRKTVTSSWIKYENGRVAYEWPERIPAAVRSVVHRLANYRVIAYTGDFPSRIEAHESIERLKRTWAHSHPRPYVVYVPRHKVWRVRIEVDE